jgi:hypothetical protein
MRWSTAVSASTWSARWPGRTSSASSVGSGTSSPRRVSIVPRFGPDMNSSASENERTAAARSPENTIFETPSNAASTTSAVIARLPDEARR